MSEKKEWANPAPAGLVALAVACFIFYALLSGKVTVGALPLMGAWLLGGFLFRLSLELLNLKKETALGVMFLHFSLRSSC